MADSKVIIHLKDFDLFKRLVDFVREVDIYADEIDDAELRQLVTDCLTDLREMARKE